MAYVVIMNKRVAIEKRISPFVSPLFMTGDERLAIWRQARGMWKDRKPDPMKELKK